MFRIGVGEYTLVCHDRGLPEPYSQYTKHARLVEEFGGEASLSERCVLAVKQGLDWPMLVVSQRCRLPGIFEPCALLVPETKLVFIGVGERLKVTDCHHSLQFPSL
jgi:hypothetical protein